MTYSRRASASYKQLLDEVFVISRIIKVKVGIIKIMFVLFH